MFTLQINTWGFFDAEKKESKVAIKGLDDIYAHAEKLMLPVENYTKETSEHVEPSQNG